MEAGHSKIEISFPFLEVKSHRLTSRPVENIIKFLKPAGNWANIKQHFLSLTGKVNHISVKKTLGKYLPVFASDTENGTGGQRISLISAYVACARKVSIVLIIFLSVNRTFFPGHTRLMKCPCRVVGL